MTGLLTEKLRLRSCREALRLKWSVLLVFSVLIAPGPIAVADGPTGREIYKVQCAACHGANGEGVEDFCPDPLHGDRPLENLIEGIVDTMPEDDPDKTNSN